MKNFLSLIGGLFVAAFKKITGGGDAVIVQLPANAAITPTLINHCINVVNIIKGIVNNPITVLVTDLTPIQLDNDIRLKISDSLPAILAGLTYEKEALANSTDNNDFVNDALAKVRLSDDTDKDAFYHTLAAKLIVVVSDGKVTWSEAVSIIEIYLKQLFGTPLVDTVETAAKDIAPVIEEAAAPAAPVAEVPAPVAEVPAATPAAPVVVETAAPITMISPAAPIDVEGLTADEVNLVLNKAIAAGVVAKSNEQ